jgi:glycosyltransferase involved in cell wall biosynthesis
MTEKIKIIYIMPSMARGGAERFLLDLINNLDRQIFTPLVILFKGTGPYYEELKALDLPIFVLEKKAKIDFFNIKKIYKILKETKPQIVHTQLGGDLRGRLAAKLAGIKIIISTEQNINRSEAWYQRITKIISSFWATDIVAISPAVALDMKKRYFLPNSKCQLIIPNGIDLKKFPYQETRPQQSPLLVGAVGRLSAQKGFDLLISAWQKLKPENAKLIIVGDGAEKKSLQEQINQAGLENQVTLAGDIPNMPAFYQTLNLMVIPSRWEGLGIVALEAGASGIPIIASSVDGLKDIVNTNNAWLSEAGDTNKLKENLANALDSLDNQETREKQRLLYDVIKTRFTIEKVSEEYAKLYLKWYRQIYENSPSK